MSRVVVPEYGWRTHGAAVAVLAVLVSVYAAGFVLLDIRFDRVWIGLARLGDIVLLMMPPDPGTFSRFLVYLDALGQTLAIAFLGTITGALFAIPLGFLAARNIVTNRVVHFLARRSLDTVRSIDTLVWALIWINVVGLGPFAGALAIASADVCALAKLMSEALTSTQGKRNMG